MQDLHDIAAPGGTAPPTRLAPDGTPLHKGPHLLETRPDKRGGKARWWKPNAAGHTNQLDRAGLYDHDAPEIRSALLGHRKLGPETAPPETWTRFGGPTLTAVDARVVVGPAVRLLDTLRTVDAHCDTDAQLAALVEPDEDTAKLVQAYVDLRDAAALGHALAELAGRTVDELLHDLAAMDAMADALQPAAPPATACQLNVHSVGTLKVDDEVLECVVLTGGRGELRALGEHLYSDVQVVLP